MANIFISYNHLPPDADLAREFHAALKEKGHDSFLAEESIFIGESWPEVISRQLEACSVFIVFLSERSLQSEMVTEEVRRAKKLKDERQESRPLILPIRINLPFEEDINYDLAGYLSGIQQRLWFSEEDTQSILNEVLFVISEGDDSDQSNTPRLVKPSDKPVPNAPLVLENPGGQIELQSKFYIERGSEDRFINHILEERTLLRIKGARQFGKTSLMSRIFAFAEKNNHHTVGISLQQLDKSSISSLPSLLKQICAITSRELGLPIQVKKFWEEDEFLSNKIICGKYFEECILNKLKKPLVLGFDESDLVIKYKDVSEDFFSMLRSWYEEAANKDIWKQIKLIITYSTEVNLDLPATQSPLNVGHGKILREFTEGEVLDLVKRHRLPWTGSEVSKLMKMVGGFPYLVRRALYDLSQNPKHTLDIFLKKATQDNGPYSDHLRRHLSILKRKPELENELTYIIKHKQASDYFCFIRLLAAGIVKGTQKNARPSIELYNIYFKNTL